jgi:hypothetical protein
MEELVKFTLPLDDCAGYPVDHDIERKKSVEALSKRLNQQQI